jgi:hypothetical protein
MPSKTRYASGAMPLLAATGVALCLASPGRADDCASVKAAMLEAVRTPHTITINRTKNGKPVTNRMVQTKDAKYIELNGKWRSLPYSAEDLREMEKSLNESTLTCARVGSDSVDGKIATVYTVHVKNEDAESDSKVWLGADARPLKSESNLDGEVSSSIYDFSHADAPADAMPIGR